MTLSGYQVVPVTPFETASKYNAVVTTSNTTAGTASSTIKFPSGIYNVAVNYFDLNGGRAQYELHIGDKLIGKWFGNNEDNLGHEPFAYLDGHSATRITFPGIKIQKGETVKIVGVPNGAELAPLDYVSILPRGIVD